MSTEEDSNWDRFWQFRLMLTPGIIRWTFVVVTALIVLAMVGAPFAYLVERSESSNVAPSEHDAKAEIKKVAAELKANSEVLHLFDSYVSLDIELVDIEELLGKSSTSAAYAEALRKNRSKRQVEKIEVREKLTPMIAPLKLDTPEDLQLAKQKFEEIRSRVVDLEKQVAGLEEVIKSDAQARSQSGSKVSFLPYLGFILGAPILWLNIRLAFETFMIFFRIHEAVTSIDERV